MTTADPVPDVGAPVATNARQRERTTQAWTRTALALLGNGVLVLVRHETAFAAPAATILAVVAGVALVLVLVQAARHGDITRRPDHLVTATSVATALVATAIAVLCAATLATVLLDR